MDLERTLVAPAPPDRVFALVDDLSVYPSWMRLAYAVDRVDTAPSEDAAWSVELRARVGPFARSKRLRMVRDVHEAPGRVVFRRSEQDGRHHAPWILTATLVPAGSGTVLTMRLHYGGNLWTGAVLQRVLDDEVRRGSERLVELVSSEPTR